MYLTGYIGRIGPLDTRSAQPQVYGLLVDADTAYRDLAYQFDRKGWGIVDREEFAAALKGDGVHAFHTRSPEAASKKRWRDRQRQRAGRAA